MNGSAKDSHKLAVSYNLSPREEVISKQKKRTNSKKKNKKNAGKKTEKVQILNEGRFKQKIVPLEDRLKWVEPERTALTLPRCDCAYCGKPVKEMAHALEDTASGQPVHFDCLLSKISEREKLSNGESVRYIGGGRFAVIHHNNQANLRDFKIKKIIEWEKKDYRSSWRSSLCEYFTIT